MSDPKEIACHKTPCGIVIKIVENIFFDDGKSFWDVVLYQSEVEAKEDLYNKGLVIDRHNLIDAQTLFNVLKREIS